MNPIRCTRSVVGSLVGAQSEILRRLGLVPAPDARVRAAAREAAEIVAAAEVEAEMIRRNARTTAEGILRLADEDRRAPQRDAG
ncbi:MAG: hypothetical protein ACKOBG_00340 [Actinomycetota bacterium]